MNPYHQTGSHHLNTHLTESTNPPHHQIQLPTTSASPVFHASPPSHGLSPNPPLDSPFPRKRPKPQEKKKRDRRSFQGPVHSIVGQRRMDWPEETVAVTVRQRYQGQGPRVMQSARPPRERRRQSFAMWDGMGRGGQDDLSGRAGGGCDGMGKSSLWSREEGGWVQPYGDE